MKKTLFCLFAIFFSIQVESQSINVNTTTYTVPQLVENILFGTSNCNGTISNITWKTGTDFGSVNGIGYFTNTNTNFPINSGIVLSTGAVSNCIGPNNTQLNEGSTAWLGDMQLFNYIQSTGIDPGLFSNNNASVIEFDYIPYINSFSFNLVFASEEYGSFQCSYSDSFAFFLTNVTDGTPTTNIAIIPNTLTPISPLTIRNEVYNPGCISNNPMYFDKFYQLPIGLNPNISPTNFNGQTVLLNANANVTPNKTYHIKLVISDRNDNALDSAIFISEGNFSSGQANISGSINSGFSSFFGDYTIENNTAICYQKTREIRAAANPILGATYQWHLNGNPILNATNYTYVIEQAGTYSVVITYASGCQQSDSILVEYNSEMPIENPTNLYSNNGIFDLTSNESIILNGQNPIDYQIYFHTILEDAQNLTNFIENPINYNGYNGQTIYISISNLVSGYDCIETRSFVLNTSLNIDDSTEIKNFDYYPNPVKTILNLSYTETITSIKIINLLGQVVLSKNIDAKQNQIETSNLSKGIYILKLYIDGGEKSIKIIKD